MTMPKDYFFDLGQVPLTWDPYLLYDKLFETTRERDWFFRNILNSEWRDRSDIYVTVRENVEIHAERNPVYAGLIRKWDTHFFTMMPNLIHSNWEIVRALQMRNRRVFGLANFARDKFAAALARFPELSSLDGCVISSEARFRKPERGIYEFACRKYGVSPREAAFVDDDTENVAAARDAGMTAILYSDQLQLVTAVEALEGESLARTYRGNAEW
jgi:FMN phosphatase YigB (HAD superfamily)